MGSCGLATRVGLVVALFVSAGLGIVVVVPAWLILLFGSEESNLLVTDVTDNAADLVAMKKMRRSASLFSIAVVVDLCGTVMAVVNDYYLAQLGCIALGAIFYVWSLRVGWGISARGKAILRLGTGLILIVTALATGLILTVVSDGGLRCLW